MGPATGFIVHPMTSYGTYHGNSMGHIVVPMGLSIISKNIYGNKVDLIENMESTIMGLRVRSME